MISCFARHISSFGFLTLLPCLFLSFSLASFWYIYYLLTLSLFSTFPSLYMISQVWGGRLNTGILVGRLVFLVGEERLIFALFLLSLFLYCYGFFFVTTLYMFLVRGVLSYFLA